MRKLVLMILAACAACGCGAQPGAQPAPAQTAPAAAAAPAAGVPPTLARIRELIGTPSCSSDAQCRTLPVGAKACGGPSGYLAFSSAQTPETELRSLGERYKEEQRAANAASGMASTCSFVADPGSVCKAGTCQLGTPVLAR